MSRRESAEWFAAVFARGPDGAGEDLAAFELAGQILGGAKSSTLFEHLREGSGAVYAIDTPVSVARTASWLSVSASYGQDKAVDGVQDVLGAIDDLRNGRVTDANVGIARETLLAQWRGTMSTVLGAANAYALWITRGLDPNRMGDHPAAIARVRREDLARVAKVYLDPKALHVGFIGDDRWLPVGSLGMGGAKVLELGE